MLYNARVRSGRRKSRRDPARARQVETLGLILISLLILLFTLARFAKTIHWSAR